MAKNSTQTSQSLIHHLFNGELNPSEIIGTSNDELLKIYEKLGELKPNLLKKLPSNVFSDLEQVDNLTEEAHDIHSRECFVYGFKLGAMLILEILSSKDELIRKDS